MNSRLSLFAIAAALLLIAAAPAAAAPKPPPVGGSTAPGQVFAPNPVADLGIQTLTDQKDADFFSADPALAKAYHRVTLTNLDGTGTLTGDYAKVLSSTGKPATNTGNGFIYTRDQDQFEQVMGYYWVTQAQRYIQSLGFGTGEFPAVNKRQQLLRMDQFGGDNSFYREGTGKLTITLGKGGVDDAEDAEVIVHEYGHSVQDNQVPGFGSTPDAGAIGEAFGDYLAVTVSEHFAPTPDEPCVADWDSTSYTSTVPHCLRRVDGNKHYPEDLVGEVHADGEIWSRALWDIHQALGATRADRIIIDAQFDFTADISMPDAATATIATARRLYGQGVANTVTAAFAARGLA
ncbi:MAG TPA: M36 family metallopeptidase [Solirubrobacteraceae bacterium]|nr:M36 family metallopeptidase [Solirubrobacteraceae bacterium]